VSGLSAATFDEPFDPLIDLDGLWTPELAGADADTFAWRSLAS
jgi:hypothetical protein